jgi:hypothetical protein
MHHSSAESFQEFWDRQQLHLDEQAAKVVHLQEELYAGLQQPRMSPGSRRLLAQKSPYVCSQHRQVDFGCHFPGSVAAVATVGCSKLLYPILLQPRVSLNHCPCFSLMRQALVQGSPVNSLEHMHVSLESSVQPYEEAMTWRDSLVQAGRSGPRPRKNAFGTLSDVENCTFRPAIRPSSRARSPRSWYAMSRGDYMRQQRSIERRRQQQEVMLTETHTFKPVLHTPPRNLARTQGRLMAMDPSFTTRVLRRDQVRAAKAQRAQHDREQKELLECTFKPTTGRMPRLIQQLMHE